MFERDKPIILIEAFQDIIFQDIIFQDIIFQ